jgi:hypothetical protein
MISPTEDPPYSLYPQITVPSYVSIACALTEPPVIEPLFRFTIRDVPWLTAAMACLIVPLAEICGCRSRRR